VNTQIACSGASQTNSERRGEGFRDAARTCRTANFRDADSRNFGVGAFRDVDSRPANPAVAVISE
jgi:hypothetical protein